MEKKQADRILYSGPVVIGGVPASVEVWSWDGHHGASVSFASEDAAQFSDNELERMVKSKFPEVEKKKMRVSRQMEKILINWEMSELDD